MTTKEILQKAKALIEEKGWCQFKSETPDGRLCMFGAIKYASEEEEQIHQGMVKLQIAGKMDRVDEWNDTPGRTIEEVLAAFDKAIASCG